MSRQGWDLTVEDAGARERQWAFSSWIFTGPALLWSNEFWIADSAIYATQFAEDLWAGISGNRQGMTT